MGITWGEAERKVKDRQQSRAFIVTSVNVRTKVIKYVSKYVKTNTII